MGSGSHHRREVGEKSSIYTAGSAFYHDEYLTTKDLKDHLKGVTSPTEFHEFVSLLNGYFSLTLEFEGGTICAAVDHCRSHPLFYTLTPVCVGDTSQSVIGDVAPSEYDALSEREFLTTSYVTGSDTLHSDLKQLEAGTSITISNNRDVTVHTHTDYYLGSERPYTAQEAINELDRVMDHVSQRVIRVADGRQVCVSLSGGHDSRMMLCSLVKQGYDDIVALTFGRTGDSDPIVARTVAHNLDINWVFVEYTPEMWQDIYGSDLWQTYYDRAFNLDSIPGLQTLPALREIATDSRIDADALIVSGQTIAGVGAHLPPKPSSRDELIDYIFNEHYSLWPASDTLESLLKARISDRLPDRSTDWLAEYSHWEWRERQAKYLYQDWLACALFDHETWYPLADQELLQFFETLPKGFQRDKSLIELYSTLLYRKIATVGEDDASVSASTSSIATKIKTAIGKSPIRPIAELLYRKYIQNPDRGDAGHLAYYGLLNKGQYSLHTTGNQTHHSFRAAEAVNRIDFCDTESHRMPPDSVIRAPSEE